MSIISRQALVEINETLTTIQKTQETHKNLEQRVTLITFDSTHDLPRIFRAPGSQNKNSGGMCKVLSMDGPEYSMSDFLPLVSLEPPQKVAATLPLPARAAPAVKAPKPDKPTKAAPATSPGIPFPLALEQRETHIDWLGEQEQAARQRLQQARQKLQEAEKALADAMQAFFRAKAREDALEKRKALWRGEVIALEARQEEDVAADLVQAAHFGRTRH